MSIHYYYCTYQGQGCIHTGVRELRVRRGIHTCYFGILFDFSLFFLGRLPLTVCGFGLATAEPYSRHEYDTPYSMILLLYARDGNDNMISPNSLFTREGKRCEIRSPSQKQDTSRSVPYPLYLAGWISVLHMQYASHLCKDVG